MQAPTGSVQINLFREKMLTQSKSSPDGTFSKVMEKFFAVARKSHRRDRCVRLTAGTASGRFEAESATGGQDAATTLPAAPPAQEHVQVPFCSSRRRGTGQQHY